MLRQVGQPGHETNALQLSNQLHPTFNVYQQQWDRSLTSCLDPLDEQDQNAQKAVAGLADFKDAILTAMNRLAQDSSTNSSLTSLLPVFLASASSSASLIQLSHYELDFSQLWGFLWVVVRHALDPESCQLIANAIRTSQQLDDYVDPTPLVQIASMIKSLSQQLELINAYCTKMTSYQGITQIAVDLHVALLLFCCAVIEGFRGTFYGKAPNARWVHILEHYKEAENIFKDILERLQHLARAAALPSVDALPRGTSRLMIQNNTDNTVKLPYEKLPRRNPQFFARKTILQQIDKGFQRGIEAGKMTAITLEGIGGVGKTQIALEYAHSKHCRRDAIFWIHSEKQVAMDEGLSSAAVDLLLTGALPHEAATNRLLLLDWLQKTDASWLLIFDNVEDALLLDEFWPARGIGSILITARKPEISSQLATERLEILPFDKNDGQGLLLSLIARPETNDEESAAVDLTTKLGGHALAISQMAAIIKSRNFSIKSFNETYDKNKKKVHRTHRSPRPTGYDHFLDTVWKMSFDYLTEAGRALLSVIAIVSPDSIPSELFLCEEPPKTPPTDMNFCEDSFSLSEIVEQLLNLALIKKNPYSEELSIHRLVQTEFWYYLPAAERQKAFSNAAKLLYGSFPKQISGRLMLQDWGACQLFIQHVLGLVALYSAKSEDGADLQPPVEFCKLMCNAAWFMSEKGLSEDLNNLLTAAFKAYDACQDPNKDPIDYAHLCNTIGVVTHNRGEFAKAGLRFRQCHDIRSQSPNPDPEEMANIYNNLGIVCFSVLDYEKAVEWHKKAEEIRMARGDDWATAKGMTHLNMSRALWRLNEKDQAWERLHFAIRQFEFSGNWYLLSHAHLLLGTFHRESDDLDGAEEHYNTAKDIMTAEGHAPFQFTTSAIMYKLGCVALQRNQADRAINHLRGSLAIAELRGVAKCDIARVNRKLAEALEVQGLRKTEAEETWATAKRLRKEIEAEFYNEADQSEAAYDRLVCGNSR